jgi:hypothetical protein
LGYGRLKIKIMIEKQVEYLKKYNIIPKTVLEIGSRDVTIKHVKNLEDSVGNIRVLMSSTV